jgi:hypothetical protein
MVNVFAPQVGKVKTALPMYNVLEDVVKKEYALLENVFVKKGNILIYHYN